MKNLDKLTVSKFASNMPTPPNTNTQTSSFDNFMSGSGFASQPQKPQQPTPNEQTNQNNPYRNLLPMMRRGFGTGMRPQQGMNRTPQFNDVMKQYRGEQSQGFGSGGLLGAGY